MGTIYVMWAIHTPLFKVGFTRDASATRRLRDVQGSCPFELKLIATRPGTIKEERRIHDELQDFHTRGEWFSLSEKTLWTLLFLRFGWDPDTLPAKTTAVGLVEMYQHTGYLTPEHYEAAFVSR